MQPLARRPAGGFRGSLRKPRRASRVRGGARSASSNHRRRQIGADQCERRSAVANSVWRNLFATRVCSLGLSQVAAAAHVRRGTFFGARLHGQHDRRCTLYVPCVWHSHSCLLADCRNYVWIFQYAPSPYCCRHTKDDSKTVNKLVKTT